ncbi:hypothetical protein GCM10008908_00800 [Clostridium subterminale]|uniref:Uncharacterized protein n=1 Tax=Clostridium subterminale TaxID=1550 RepID=A0ABN1KFU2_CLOSU
MDKAEEFFSNNSFENCFAFNHVLGLSCNAYHGNLHESKKYIANLLGEYGYSIEHENVYYSINLNTAQQVEIDDYIQIIKSGVNEHSKNDRNSIFKRKGNFMKYATGGTRND